jgi:hypothetical protein
MGSLIGLECLLRYFGEGNVIHLWRIALLDGSEGGELIRLVGLTDRIANDISEGWAGAGLRIHMDEALECPFDVLSAVDLAH